MNIKRVLIIQTDDSYFLHETLQVLTANSADLAEFDLTVLVAPRSLEQLRSVGYPVPSWVTTDPLAVRQKEYDLSFNLSLNEASWQLHGDVRAPKKSGAYYEGDELRVPGIWAAWFLTFKGNAPFVTFHMREIFRNILGLKKKTLAAAGSPPLARTFIIGAASADFFSHEEQESFITGLMRRFPGIKILDESEVRLDQDQSNTFYVGPASLKALLICEAGAQAIFYGSRFQGLNLLPEKDGVMLLTTGGKKLQSQPLLNALEVILKDREPDATRELNLYHLSMENVFGAGLDPVWGHEVSYPFYQAHLVLWNYLLALQDVNLSLRPPHHEQVLVLDSQLEILKKLLRLHDYAMVAVDGVYREARSASSDPEKLQAGLNTLTEIDATFDKISATNPFLRPVIDFYRIRKGQVEGASLLERSQNSLLAYTVEHQALSAFEDLLTKLRSHT